MAYAKKFNDRLLEIVSGIMFIRFIYIFKQNIYNLQSMHCNATLE